MVRSQTNCFKIKKLEDWQRYRTISHVLKLELGVCLAIRKRMKLKYLAIRKQMKLKYLCQDKSKEATLAYYQYQA